MSAQDHVVDVNNNNQNNDAPADYAAKLYQAQIYSRIIRMLCIIDGLFLIFWGVFYLWGLLALLCVITGYFGAKAYNPWLTSFYAGYQLAAMAVRIWFLSSDIDNRAFFIVITAIGIAVNAYLFYITCRFIYLCSEINEIDIIALRLSESWFGYGEPYYVAQPVAIYAQPATVYQAQPIYAAHTYQTQQPGPTYAQAPQQPAAYMGPQSNTIPQQSTYTPYTPQYSADFVGSPLYASAPKPSAEGFDASKYSQARPNYQSNVNNSSNNNNPHTSAA